MLVNEANDSILAVGEVSGVEGTRVFVRMNRNKNVSDLLYQGTILKNVSVGGFVEIRKGYISLFGKIEGERLSEDDRSGKEFGKDHNLLRTDTNSRYLQLALVGYTDFSSTICVNSTRARRLKSHQHWLKISRFPSLWTEYSTPT